MPKVVYETPDGGRRTVEGHAGDSVMETAVKNGVPGIVAECGGAASCATCHVYVDEAQLPLLPEMEDLEEDMLECVTAELLPGSRLSCQIALTDELDGLTVRIPETQT